MVPAPCTPTAPVPPPAYQRAVTKRGPARHIDALALVTRLHLRALCRLAVQQAQRRCPPPLPAGPGGTPRRYMEESLLRIALLRTLWRLSPRALADGLRAWPALAFACGRPARPDGTPWVPRPSPPGKRAARAGPPPCATLVVRVVTDALTRRSSGARALIIDSAPITAWRRRDPDAAQGQAPAHHPTAFRRGDRVHTLLCRGSGLPLVVRVAPANGHDAPFAQPLRAAAVALSHLRPRVVRLAAASWGLTLIAWLHATLGAGAVIPFTPTALKDRSCLPPTWTTEERGKRSSIARFFGRVFLFVRLQRPPLAGWSAVTCQVALTYTAVIVIALVAHDAGRPDLIRSPARVLAHCWEGIL
jgi:hypothetical protein